LIEIIKQRIGVFGGCETEDANIAYDPYKSIQKKNNYVGIKEIAYVLLLVCVLSVNGKNNGLNHKAESEKPYS